MASNKGTYVLPFREFLLKLKLYILPHETEYTVLYSVQHKQYHTATVLEYEHIRTTLVHVCT